MLQCDGFTLDVVRLPKGHITKWAIKATMGEVSKYRSFYYKADAELEIKLEWANYSRFAMETELFYRHNWCDLTNLQKG